MKIYCKKFIAIAILMVIGQASKSQIAVGNLGLVPSDKNKVTYVMMKDPQAESAQPFIKAIEDAWTIGKLEFIKYSDQSNYNSSENYFLSISGIIFTTKFKKDGGQGNADFSNTHVYLEYYKAAASTEKTGKKGKVTIIEGEKKQIARIELYTDFQTLMDPANIFANEFDGEGHIRNWGPGILKNYLQSLMGLIKNNQERGLYTNIDKSTDLKKLRNSVLYVSEDVLIKFGKFNGDESKRFDEEDIFKNYSLKYKLISVKELNEKILTEKEPIYYLLYIKSSTDKYVTIINSITGEMQYTHYTPVSYNFKSDDIEDVQKAIMKN